ncbi:MAG: FlgD immunoglobulin-like domain containing protein [Candidatus Eisenbacteria bacterium]
MCASAGSSWQWSGPGGFAATSECVTVTTPGTYSLRVWDGLNGLWSAPCTWAFGQVPAGPACSIAGDDSVCAGESTMWCAPSGAAAYSWTSPSGRHGSSTCTFVSEPGEYTLVLTDANGATETCRRTLIVYDCSPPQLGAVCPMSARAWARSCGASGGYVSADAFADVAARVDERSAVWSFGGTASGLCSILRRDRHHGSEAWRAKRHYAAVLANLSAADAQVVAADGHGVGLDANMTLDSLRGVTPGTTLGTWVAATEARLLELSTSPARSRMARAEYRRIARQARAIDRITTGCPASAAALLVDEDEDDDDGMLRPEDSSVSTSGSGATVSTAPRSNPSTGLTELRWTLERSAAVELVIMDITGRRIRHLASGTFAAGTHVFTWDGRDDDGRAARVGAYFVAGRVGRERLTQRLFLLR